ncbi:hypothetical protein [Ramlibacter sp. 2FC]|uniref:hypothetical protein n=1 Tax=Ramlibacter sp. 2FC TaxID=2502188 RepID=UPI0010F83C8F|nr:hypothetical protein [Ramlibacter sp. 2FC]
MRAALSLLSRRWQALALLLLAGCAARPLPPQPAAAPPAPLAQPSPAPKAPSSVRFGDGLLDQFELQVQGGHCLLRWRGEFPADAVPALGQALSELEQHRCTRKTLALDLRGGDIGPATTLGAMLRNRQFDTELLPGSRCQTPCALVFAAGRQRLMPEDGHQAQLLLSQVRRDQDFGQAVCETELNRGQQLTLTRYLRAMLPPATAAVVYQKISRATCRRHDILDASEALATGLATGMLPASLR